MHYLLYKSRATGRITWETIHDILETSDRNNSRDGITGVLLATRDEYLQMLEGERDQLKTLFARISADPRHDRIEVIGFNACDDRRFAQWTMHGVGLFDFRTELAAGLVERYGNASGEFRFPAEEALALELIDEVVESETG